MLANLLLGGESRLAVAVAAANVSSLSPMGMVYKVAHYFLLLYIIMNFTLIYFMWHSPYLY